MKELSATVTVGEGSEIHNHDLEYRSTLEHVHGRAEGVIELVPYRDYREQINELMRPYIDEYNAKVQQRYQDAWDRYNRGEIKTKPRKRDFKAMGYDYYNDHKNDVYHNRKTGKQEQVPMFRSLIIGIGDKEDRLKERITEPQAREIMRDVVAQFREDFPDLKILGATLHLDEQGFYHMHLDFKPMYDRDIGQGLNVGIGLDSALEGMGYKPEQSIINGRDKVPLLFNAMRNKIYYSIEAAMAEQGLRMQYRATEVKEPGKDSSKNQRLEDWQATQDAVREIQHSKNVALDILERDEVTPEEVKTAITAIEDMSSKLEEVKQSPRSRLSKDKVVVGFHLLDQLGSFVERVKTFFAAIIKERDEWKREALERRAQASRGRYMSDFDLEMRDARLKSQLHNEQVKRENLENFLEQNGISQRQIENIELGSSGRSRGPTWDDR